MSGSLALGIRAALRGGLLRVGGHGQNRSASSPVKDIFEYLVSSPHFDFTVPFYFRFSFRSSIENPAVLKIIPQKSFFLGFVSPSRFGFPAPPIVNSVILMVRLRTFFSEGAQ